MLQPRPRRRSAVAGTWLLQGRRALAAAGCTALALTALVGSGGSATGSPAGGAQQGLAQRVPARSTGQVLPALTHAAEPVLVPVQTTGDGTGDPLSARRVRTAVSDVLGSAVPASVVDVASGRRLVAGPTRPAAPASTMKLVTAAAALSALGPDEILRTRTYLLNADSRTPTVVIVGAGDSSLTSQTRAVGLPGTMAYPASTAELASRTARALSLQGVTRVRVAYDDSLFRGPRLHPDWARSFPAAGVVAPVSALMVDHGARVPGGVSRVADPAAAAGRTFAGQLQRAGLVVIGAPRRKQRDGAGSVVAEVTSPPIGDMVERMLGTSDNDLAEALAHLAAAAEGRPASFTGASRQARATLRGLGVDTDGLVLRDGSGLSRRNRLTAACLTDLLVTLARPAGSAAASSAGPSAASAQQGRAAGSAPETAQPSGSLDRLTWASPLLSGLPVAAASGSLRTRFDDPAETAGRAVVRAKTGTLTGVAGLAGYASRPDGRLVAFAFLDDRARTGALAARNRLDRAAAALVRCKCAR